MIVAALLAGDAWTWRVALRYSDAEGVLLDDRERWTVRVVAGGAATAERAFVGTMVDDGTLVPSPSSKPETLNGRIEADGTLAFKGDWSDPDATRLLRRLLRPDARKDETVPGWPVVRRTVLRETARLPGNVREAALRVEVSLASAHLGGRDVVLAQQAAPPPTPSPTVPPFVPQGEPS